MKNSDTSQVVYEALVKARCLTKSEILRIAGRNTRCCDDLLATMEAQGFLLSEDEKGLVYPFRRMV